MLDKHLLVRNSSPTSSSTFSEASKNSFLKGVSIVYLKVMAKLKTSILLQRFVNLMRRYYCRQGDVMVLLLFPCDISWLLPLDKLAWWFFLVQPYLLLTIHYPQDLSLSFPFFSFSFFFLFIFILYLLSSSSSSFYCEQNVNKISEQNQTLQNFFHPPSPHFQLSFFTDSSYKIYYLPSSYERKHERKLCDQPGVQAFAASITRKTMVQEMRRLARSKRHGH